jgi:hypothetical protein
MRFAAIYDIHANLPALEALLQDNRQVEVVDHVVVGAMCFPARWQVKQSRVCWGLEIAVQFTQGNGDRGCLRRSRGNGLVSHRPRIVARARALDSAATDAVFAIQRLGRPIMATSSSAWPRVTPQKFRGWLKGGIQTENPARGSGPRLPAARGCRRIPMPTRIQ